MENPWVDANGKPIIDNEESKRMYEDQQKLRRMERAIRKTKRELLMKEQEIAGVAETDVKAILQEDYDKLAYKLRQQNQRYNEFCEEKHLQKQSERIKAAGFRRKEAARARGAATRYANKQDKQKSGLSANHGVTAENHEAPIILGRIEDASKAAETLMEYEKMIADEPIENAIVITKDGQIIQCFGYKNDVWPNIDLGERIIGSSITHNHPIDSENEYSFSNSDLNLFMEYELEILRGIDERYIYQFTRNPEDIDDFVEICNMTEYDYKHMDNIRKALKLGIGYRRWLRE